MKKTLLLFILPLLSIAQVPAYYNTIDLTLTGNALKDELGELITTTHTNDLVYTPGVWDALRQTDLDPEDATNTNVLLIYGYNDNDSDVSNDRTRSKFLTCHTSSCSGLWVREHVFPRSLGQPNLEFEGPGSDAHHLRSIDNSMNNSRSNRIFADDSGNAHTMANSRFYPGDEWKGDVARMMMYMYVRYGAQCQATSVGYGSSSYSYYGDMPNIFLEWNEQDPVSTYEMNRNNLLETIQGNRNPFIDNPYLATIIWNGPQATDTWNLLGTDNSNEISSVFVYPTVTTGVVNLQNIKDVNYTYIVYNMLGQNVSFYQQDNVIDLGNNTSGMYFLTLTNQNTSKTFKIILKQ